MYKCRQRLKREESEREIDREKQSNGLSRSIKSINRNRIVKVNSNMLIERTMKLEKHKHKIVAWIC